MCDIKDELKKQIENIDINNFDFHAYDNLTTTRGFGEIEYKLLAKKIGTTKMEELIKQSDEAFFYSLSIEDIADKEAEIEISHILYETVRKDKSSMNDEQYLIARRIIPRITNNKDSRYYIKKQFKEYGKINFEDMINAYNYFVIGD
ncbi:MAG: hypothetical protein E7338_05675 [Clostridiales bacterium]|nr:hypothetical protein [Clostridiales bacterium]